MDSNDSRISARDQFLLNSRLFLVLPALAVALMWMAWPALSETVERWSNDPRYSHGYLVPGFAAFLLWYRRGVLKPVRPQMSWWGVPLIAAGEALRFAGARYYIQWFEMLALLPSLAGLCLLIAGPRALRWAAPAIAFLFFMIPLPYRIEHALGAPLQGIATGASTYILQTLGLPAVAEGYVIQLGAERQIGVVEACNGLGMLFMFLAFAAATVLVIRRSVTDKVILILSAVPIAVIANVVRITVTGLLYEIASDRVAEAVYHDLAGWLMMPMALAAFWLVLLLLSNLFLEPPEPSRPLPFDLGTLGRTGREQREAHA